MIEDLTCNNLPHFALLPVGCGQGVFTHSVSNTLVQAYLGEVGKFTKAFSTFLWVLWPTLANLMQREIFRFTFD